MRSWNYLTGTLAIVVALAATSARVESQAAPAAVTPVGPRLLVPRTRAFETLSAPDRPSGIVPAAWAGARGTWQSSVEDGISQAHVSFTGLVPGGHYALFERHTTAKGPATIALDGSGTTNTFTASPDGSATVTMSVPQAPVRGDTVMLVYRSDATANATAIGRPRVDGHTQLRIVMR